MEADWDRGAAAEESWKQLSYTPDAYTFTTELYSERILPKYDRKYAVYICSGCIHLIWH